MSRRFTKGARAWAALLIAFGILAPALAGATTLLSQTFISDDELVKGSIVSLQKGSSDRVESAKASNVDYILGVVIDSNSAQLSISSNQQNQVLVATSGIQQVLVSDINGSIAVGDHITASPISSVGMRATGNTKVVGVAQEAFPNNSASKKSYTDQSGKEQSALLGEISVLINVAYYYKEPDKTLIPPAVQNIANALAGKKVEALPIIISIAIFIITLIVVVSIIYSLIHSSIISVGRNPMAQAAVYRNVIQLSGLVILILGVSVGSIYMLLTRL